MFIRCGQRVLAGRKKAQGTVEVDHDAETAEGHKICGGPGQFTAGAPVAFKSFSGHQYRVGIICPLPD